MSKTGRKWLKRNWSDSDCVRAQDIPYSESESIKARLDNSYQKSETYSKTEVENLIGTGGGGMSLWQSEMLSYE